MMCVQWEPHVRTMGTCSPCPQMCMCNPTRCIVQIACCQVTIDNHDFQGILDFKFSKVRMYSHHLQQVFMDKSLLWGQRNTAMASVHSMASPCDFLMVVSDAIDQSHWALPRDPQLRSVKSLAAYKRPTCVVVVVWVIGHLCRFWVLDQDQAHDATCTADLVARTLEEVRSMLQVQGRAMPPNVIYWVPTAKLDVECLQHLFQSNCKSSRHPLLLLLLGVVVVAWCLLLL